MIQFAAKWNETLFKYCNSYLKTKQSEFQFQYTYIFFCLHSANFHRSSAAQFRFAKIKWFFVKENN